MVRKFTKWYCQVWQWIHVAMELSIRIEFIGETEHAVEKRGPAKDDIQSVNLAGLPPEVYTHGGDEEH